MSDESDTNDGNVHAETVKSEVQEALIKLEKLCAGEAKCSVSQNLDAIQIEKTESLKTEQDTCTNTIPEIEVDEMTKVEEIEIAPSSPVSPSVTVLPNEDNAEKNANFDLVFPYGHEFMIEGERPLAVLIAKENGDSDRTRQYENYDEWFSRISKEHSSESVWINVRKRELRGGKPVSPSLTTTSSVQPSCLNNIKMEHVDINENNIPNTSRDITRSPKSQPRLMVKNPEQINKPILDKIMRNDGIVCGTYVAIDNCNVDHTNTLPATCSYQTNVTRSHQSRQKLMVKKPNQINDKTTEKRMPTDHNYCSNSNKIRGKKMDQVCVSDLPSKLQHNHESRSPRVAVKKFNQINEPTLDKRMQIDHDYCQNADNIKDCNVSHISISSVPPSCQCYKIVDQVCTCNDIPVTLQNDVVTDMMRSHESRPRQTVKRPDKINEPIPNKRMRTDKNNINISPTPHSSQSNKKTEQICISHNAIPLVENSDTINDCNVDNTSIAHLSQTNKKQDKECVRDKDIAVTLQHIASSIERRHESRPRLVEKRSNVNILKKKKQVDNYCDVDKINKDSSVDSINGEDALSDKEHFEWVSIDSFHGIRESFMITQTGSVTSHDTIYDAFRAIWDDYILKTIALETNRYANSPLSSDEFKKQWYDTNAHEILVLFTFWIMLGVIRMPTIKSCFSNDPLLKVNVFKTMFTKNRYDSLVSALRFANDNIKSSKASELHCINVILDHLNKKFQSNFVPDQNISVDESFLPWKGSLSFQQVHTSINTENSGIKTLELCDSATGYLWSLLIYSGDEKESVESQTKSTVQKYNATVLKLIRPLLNKGYTVYMNVSLISPTLARFLKKNKTDCVAMIDPSLEGVQHIVELANMKPGHVLAQHAIDVCIMAWYSKKKNIYISTYHGTELKEPPHEKHHPKGWKPQVVVDCDKNLGVVGRKNVMLEPYVSEKRNRCDRWHIKLLKRMLNSSILNAQILLESSKKMKVDHLAARLQLVDIILGRHLCLCPVTKWDSRQTLKLPPWRDSGGGHWPALCEPAGATTNQSRCVFCISKGFSDNRTEYKCDQCDVPLCVLCFKGYHNQSM